MSLLNNCKSSGSKYSSVSEFVVFIIRMTVINALLSQTTLEIDGTPLATFCSISIISDF